MFNNTKEVSTSNLFVQVIDFLGISRPKKNLGFLTRFIGVFLSIFLYLPFGWIEIFLSRSDLKHGNIREVAIWQVAGFFAWVFLYFIGAIWLGIEGGWNFILNPLMGILTIALIVFVKILFFAINDAISQDIVYVDDKKK